MEKSIKIIKSKLMWRNYEFFHQRRIQNNDVLNKLKKFFNTLTSSTEDYIKAINLPKIKTSFESLDKNDLLYQSIIHIINNFEIQLNQLHLGIKILNKEFFEFINTSKFDELKNEQFLYNELNKSKTDYYNNKELINKYKEKYYDNMYQALLLISNESKFQNAKIKVIKYFGKYKDYIKKTNELRNLYIENQKNIISFYLESEKNEVNLIKSILKEYYEQQKLQNDVIKNYISNNENSYSHFQVFNEMDNIIHNFIKNNNTKIEQKADFIDYEPKKNFNIYESILIYNNYIDAINKLKSKVEEELLPSININKEKKKKELGQLLFNFFSKDPVQNSQADVNKIQNYIIYDDTSTHYYFLGMLTSLRGAGNFCKSEKFIKKIGSIFNDLLLNAEKNKNIDIARNCIIISETYYYLDNNNKIFLKVFIRKNKWLRSPDFWRYFILDSLNKEIIKFSNSENDAKAEKFGEIIFSCLVPFFNNLKYYIREKRVANKILNEFIIKFNLNNQYIKTIYNIINENKNKY